MIIFIVDINEEKYQSVAKILFELLNQFPSFFAYDDVSNFNANSCKFCELIAVYLTV